MSYFADQDFTALDELPPGEYDHCSFSNCILTGSKLSGHSFHDCSFTDCELSNADLTDTSLQTVEFRRCKLIGIHFEDARDFLFRVTFYNCQLELSTFIGCKLTGTVFRDSRLPETDFTNADLRKADFSGSDLHRTLFDRTDLREADFVTAKNYRLDPAENRIRGAAFSRLGLEGLLAVHGIKVQ